MKTIFFTLAVLSAALYLGYSQSAEIRSWLNMDVLPHTEEAADIINDMGENLGSHISQVNDNWSAQVQRISDLEQQVKRLHQQLEAAESKTVIDRLLDVPDDIIDDSQKLDNEDLFRTEVASLVKMSVRDRSAALIELAERMELKAIGY